MKVVLYNIVSISIFFLIPLLSLAATEQTVEGRIFRKDGERELLYVQKEFFRSMGNTSEISHVYFKENQLEAAFEKVTVSQGKLDFYEVAINDLDSYGSIIREGDSLRLYFRQNEKEKSREIPYETSLLTGPQLPGFIQQNRNRLIRGEVLDFHLPFLERQTIIPFQLIPGRNDAPEGLISVEMKLKNLFLGMFIDPVEFLIDTDSGRVMEIHGPTILPDPYSSRKKTTVDTQIYYNYF